METAFSPHPKWRQTFEFVAQYPNVDKSFNEDSVINSIKAEKFEFVPDPVLNKFSHENTRLHIQST